uniref:Uncharacterized protein n=1 Tax=Astatotilapia calliptera TaxID=8154 RepID=A0AAX7UJW7_ASTCA
LLGVPKNGNTAVSLKPLGGAPVPPLTAKSPITPKTVKRSLATFRDIFASVIESSTGKTLFSAGVSMLTYHM